MVGASLAIGAASTLASSILGGVASANSNNRRDALIETEKKENQKRFDAMMNGDFIMRRSNQATLKKGSELVREYFKEADQKALVTDQPGITTADRASAIQGLSGTMTNVAGEATAYEDSVEQQTRQQNAALTQQQIGAEAGQAQQTAAAAAQGVTTGLNLIGSALKSTADGIVKEKN